jgi:hypothetical protein
MTDKLMHRTDYSSDLSHYLWTQYGIESLALRATIFFLADNELKKNPLFQELVKEKRTTPEKFISDFNASCESYWKGFRK